MTSTSIAPVEQTGDLPAGTAPPPSTGPAASNLALALKLCDLGLSVIPAGLDKGPCVKWKAFQAERPNADQIRAWDAKLRPAVWGIVTGAISGRVVIDFDGAAGEATRVNCFGSLDPHVRTPSGGTHVHVACPPFPVKTLNHKTSKDAPWVREFPGVDVRADGGFEALIGTTDKGKYQIVRDLATPYPWDALPSEFRRYFEPMKESVKPTINALIDRALASAPTDGRNNGGFWLGCQLRDNGYSQPEAETALRQYQSRTGPTNTKGETELYTAEAAMNSVHEAFKAPVREPWAKGRPRVVEMPACAEPSGLPQWLRDELIKGAKGKTPLGNLANVARVLREYPDWKGRLRLDELRMRVTAVNPTPIGAVADGLWLDQHDLRLAEWMQHREILAGKITVGEAVFMVSCENAFHPVRDYLQPLKWDGQLRLDTWLPTYCGARGPEAQSTDVLAAMGRKFLVQAVARVMQTSVKADYVLVLEGPQGYFKSTVFAVLGGEWYTDDLAAFGTKDAALSVAGMWFIELPELVRLRGANVNIIKSFLSRTVDRFRPPYGRHMMEVPRTNVFCGTTNDDEYLLDVTGNRRFWPVQVFEPADIDALRRDRDQLWAEAVHRYHHHEEFWIQAGSELEKLLAGEQELRVVEDELEAPVIEWVSRFIAHEMRHRESAQGMGVWIAEPSVTIYQILTLGLATGMGDPATASLHLRELGPRIGRILRKHGWRRYKRGPRGSRQYQYHPPISWDWQAVLAMDTGK